MARLALVTGRDLGQALADLGPRRGRAMAWLCGLAVMGGILAFQAGNLSGAGLGLAAVTGQPTGAWTAAVAAAAAGLLLTGRYRLVERVLMVCVALMATMFVTTAILVAPRWQPLAEGLLVPHLPPGSALTVLALVGTTIVPYNLYLHAAAVRTQFAPGELPSARRDLLLAVSLGGLISAAIVVTASALPEGDAIRSATDMARQLEPLLGAWAAGLFGAGLAAAGLTSAITAPLAAGYVAAGLAGSQPRLDQAPVRATMMACIGVGAAIALAGAQPVTLIFLAQAANGLILPVLVLAVLLALNDRKRLGERVNGVPGNIAGGAILILCALLAARVLLT